MTAAVSTSPVQTASPKSTSHDSKPDTTSLQALINEAREGTTQVATAARNASSVFGNPAKP